MHTLLSNRLFLVGLITVLCTAIFVIALNISLGVASCALYIFPVLMTIYLPAARSTLWTAVLCSGLMLTGFYYSPEGDVLEEVLMNHALALFVIWGAALFIIINKQTKEKLQFTQFAIDRSGDAAFWMGPDDQFIYVNEATCRSLGYSREELLQMTIYDIDPGLPREIGESLWQQIKENKYLSFEATHRRKDGTVFPVAIMSIYLEFQGKDYACQFARDITERKQAVNAVEKSENRLRQLLDEMLEGCMIIGFDWTYLYINDAAARHVYKRRAELIGRTMPEMYPGVERSEIFAAYRRVMEQRKPERLDVSFTFPDGAIGWYEISVQPVPEGIFVLKNILFML